MWNYNKIFRLILVIVIRINLYMTKCHITSSVALKE